MAKCLHCVLGGRVQGVFFRSFVLDQARALGLKGWVRNLSGGRLEVDAQGDLPALEELAARLRLGPPLARVDTMETQWTERETTFTNFQIKR